MVGAGAHCAAMDRLGIKRAAFGVAATLVATCATADTHAGLLPYRDAQAVAQGKTLYGNHCAACHGAQLQGEPDWRDRDKDGFLPAPPHDVTGHTWHHPDAQLFAITKFGIEALVGNGYQSRMPEYQNILRDDEILSVLAFIKSTWPEAVIARHDQMNRMAGN